ncbi:MAG: co-chaperone GroES family protein [Bacteroidota bacterium]
MEIPQLNLDKLIIIGDRVLIRPKTDSDKTSSGLFLPPGVLEKENIQSGYVIKIGPGYPIPVATEDHEPWKEPQEDIKYIPLQIKEGDLAIFLQKGAYEVMYEGVKFYIVPQNAILMVERDEELFD